MGTTRRLLLGAPHLPGRLWAEAFKAAIYIKNRTPTDVLDGKAPLEVWEHKPLGNLPHIHEWGLLAFKRGETRFRPNKLAARAKKMHLVGYGGLYVGRTGCGTQQNPSRSPTPLRYRFARRKRVAYFPPR